MSRAQQLLEMINKLSELKVVCAWCRKPLGEVEPLSNGDTTHSICPTCYNKLMKDVKKHK